MNKTTNGKRNSRSRKAKKYIKIDAFGQAIEAMAKSIAFDPTLMIDCFKEDKIRSSDFSLDGFKTRQEFVVEYCQKQKELKLVKGKLIKLYQALNTKYRITGSCQRVPSIPNLFNSGSLVFISPKYTQQIISDKLICSAESETLDDSKRLYQYLNWTIRVNKINKYVNCFSTNKQDNNIQFLLINSELHDRNNNVLYMFCIENDIQSEKAQKWQFVKLVTAAELIELVPDCALEQIISQVMDDQDSVCSVDINNISCIISQFMGEYCDNKILPLGARGNGSQFNQLNQNRMMTKHDILYPNENISYLQLKGIQTGHDKNRKGNKKNKKEVLKISLLEFERKIEAAADSDDPRHDLIPIVSILSGKKYGEGNYSVDQVLPVYIRGHWVAICYRDGKPVMELFDGYDITNKAILCEPTFDKDRLAFFANNIYKIEILPRDQLDQLPQDMESLYNQTPELTPNTPTPESIDFVTTPLALEDVSSAEQEDVYMQFEEQPDHPDSSSLSSCSSSITQTQMFAEDRQEMKYNYINEACHNKNDIQTSGAMNMNTNMNMNMNMNMNISPSSINGEGMMNNITTRNTNTNTIAIQTTPISMDGMNTNTNVFNTNTPMSTMGNTAMNLNHVQSMNPINGQYQYQIKPKNQPQQLQQQLYNQQIYINNFNYMLQTMPTMPTTMPTMPMMPNFQLQNALNNMNLSTPKPSEGFQTTSFQPLNFSVPPPQTLQNTTFVPIYCYLPLPTMSAPLMQQPIISNQQAQPLNSTPICNILKATTPEFIPTQPQNRQLSIPKPASIVPKVSTIFEEN